jgi:arylsulfatase A-like enzyme
MLTGLPVSLHGVHFGERSFVTHAFEEVRWLPEQLATAGYRSLAVIANVLALPEEPLHFDVTIAPQRTDWHASTITALVDHRSPLLQSLSERLRWRMPYVAAADVVERAITACSAAPEGTFVLVNLTDAHSPYNPPAWALRELGLEPARLFPRYLSHRELSGRWSRLPQDRASVLIDLYDAQLRGMDAALERLLHWIEQRHAGRAFVIVTSDHGEELGEDGRVGHEHGLAQRLLHVPLAIRGPGVAASRAREPVDLRRLHGFIHALAARGVPDLALLFAGDEHGRIAERYPSGHTGGPTRPTVALLEDDLKLVGPSPTPTGASTAIGAARPPRSTTTSASACARSATSTDGPRVVYCRSF